MKITPVKQHDHDNPGRTALQSGLHWYTYRMHITWSFSTFSLQGNRMIWAGTKEGMLSFGLGLPYRILKTEILRDTTGILKLP